MAANTDKGGNLHVDGNYFKGDRTRTFIASIPLPPATDLASAISTVNTLLTSYNALLLELKQNGLIRGSISTE